MGRVVEKVWPTLATCSGGLFPWAQSCCGRARAGTSVWTHVVIVKQHPAFAWDFFVLTFWMENSSFLHSWSIADGPIQIIQPGSYYFTVFSESQRRHTALLERNSRLSCLLVLLFLSPFVYDEAWWWPLKVSPDHHQIKRIFKCLALRNREPSWMLSSRLDTVCPSSSIPCGAPFSLSWSLPPTRVPFAVPEYAKDSARFFVLYNYLIMWL